jgi:SAM-dependent methyltransferase
MATTGAEAETPLTAEQLFDSVGPAYEDAFANLENQMASLRWLIHELPPSSRIVDVGCGTGNPVVSTLAGAGHSVLGIDVSGAMIAAARQRVPVASFEQVDVRAFLQRPDQEGAYDAVTVYFSLIAGLSQAEIREAISGLGGLLRPGGLFVFATVPIAADNQELRWMGRKTIVSSLPAQEAVMAVEKAGLVIEHQDTSNFLPRAAEAGICDADDVWEEPHLFLYARKVVQKDRS